MNNRRPGLAGLIRKEKQNRWTEPRIRRELRRLANKHVGIEFQVVRIDGEFAGILPVDPFTGEVTTTHPSELQRSILLHAKRQAVDAQWEKVGPRHWRMK